MYFVRRNPDFRTLSTFIRYYSVAKRSHYDVLNLRRNCTDREIKEAFIHMSKEFHPDKNKDVNAQEQFVRIVEAYNVLSKPSSRAQYDTLTDWEATTHSEPFVYRTRNAYRYRPQYNQYYETQSQRQSQSRSKAKETKNEKTKSYYGFTGVKKVPNYVIIMLCFGIAFVGTFIQVVIIRELYVVHRRQAQERSRHLVEELERVRERAQSNGNEVQTRLLLEKIVAAANPTVATASLGQALANEKK